MRARPAASHATLESVESTDSLAAAALIAPEQRPPSEIEVHALEVPVTMTQAPSTATVVLDQYRSRITLGERSMDTDLDLSNFEAFLRTRGQAPA